MNATFRTTRLNMSSKTKSTKGCWWENYFCCARASTTEYNKVAWGGQTSTTSYNIAENKRNVVSYNICLVKSLIAIRLYTTRYNTIKHDTTRFKKYLYLSHPIQFFVLSTEVKNWILFTGRCWKVCVFIYSLNVQCVYVWCLIIITILSWRTFPLQIWPVKRHSNEFVSTETACKR